MLEARGLVAGFGSHTVLHGVDLEVADGEFAGIFGLNGAGKSVTLKVLAGLVPAWEGSVHFQGQDITKLSPEARVEAGLGHVPQGRNVFANLTVEENLRLGAYTSRRRSRRSGRYASKLDEMFDRFPILAERRTQIAGTLSGGQQASLAVARALINEPKLIFVDEASAGVAPIVAADLLETLRSVARSGVTMLMVEQNVAFGLQIVDRAHVMQTGRVVYAGSVRTLDRDRLANYLGIGRMLGASTKQALTKRKSKKAPPKKKPVAKSAKRKPVAKKKAVARSAKTKAPAKKPAPRRKR
jgi:branched-chain amino acid transport system ATP-binding protein